MYSWAPKKSGDSMYRLNTETASNTGANRDTRLAVTRQSRARGSTHMPRTSDTHRALVASSEE